MLLNRLFPKDGETLLSYHCRLAHGNSYSFNTFSTYITQSSARYQSNDASERSEIIRFTKKITNYDTVVDVIDIRSFYRINHPLFNFDEVKFCSLCFNENGGCVSGIHAFRHVLVCDKHMNLLIDKCTACGADFSAHTLSKRRCLECETPISAMRSKPVSVDATSAIFYAVFKDATTHKLFADALNALEYELNTKLVIASHLDWIRKQPHLPNLVGYNQYMKQFKALSVQERYQAQQQLSHFLADDEAVMELLIDVFSAAAMEPGLEISDLLKGLDRYINSKGSEFITDKLKKVLMDCYSQFAHIDIKLGWVEKLFEISENALTAFIEDNHKYILLKRRIKSIPYHAVRDMVEQYNNSTRSADVWEKAT